MSYQASQTGPTRRSITASSAMRAPGFAYAMGAACAGSLAARDMSLLARPPPEHPRGRASPYGPSPLLPGYDQLTWSTATESVVVQHRAGPVCRQPPRNDAPSSRFDPNYPRFPLRFLPTTAPMPYISYGCRAGVQHLVPGDLEPRLV
ncbi:hypothetical protein CPLU01_04973 [Colletotrichum plurivorum]|uniref:Uncharacterized protein n=1 Tax=Colletotrichum plurivorum TaxID=2175906 RepID=A0A8H6KMN1_9PEZI|nr:hypothetical protein CPLU01_04973 [Colletotrichum plurivorum]